MGFRALLVLLLLAGGLGAILYFAEDEEIVDPGSIMVPALQGHRLGDALRIHVQRVDGGAPVVMEAAGQGRFRLTEPVRDLASRAWLQTMASAFDSAQVAEEKKVAELSDEQLEERGLLEPRAVFEATFPNEVVKLEVGGKGFGGEEVFVRRGDTVFRGGTALLSALQFNPDDIRERQMFEHRVTDVRRIELRRRQPANSTASDGTVVETVTALVRGGEGWKMVEPLETRADPSAVSSLLGAAVGLRAAGFPAGLVRLPERPADGTVIVKGNRGTEQADLWILESGSVLGHVVGRDVVFTTLPNSFRDLFGLSVDMLRSRWLISPQVREFSRIVLDPGAASGGVDGVLAERVVFTRQGDVPFRMIEPRAADTAPTAINELLHAIQSLGVGGFVDGDPADAKFGLAQGFFTLSVLPTSGIETTIRLGKPQGDQFVYARRGDDAQVVLVPRKTLEVMQRTWATYVSRDVYRSAVKPLAIGVRVPEGAEFDRSAGEATYRFVGAAWVPVDLSGEALDPQPEDKPTFLRDLVDEIRELRAREVVPTNDTLTAAPPVSLFIARDQPRDVLASFEVWPAPAALDPEGEELVLMGVPGRDGVVFLLKARASQLVRRLIAF